MLTFKEGQTYVSTESRVSWWTEGKEYPVIYNNFGRLALKDNNGNLWYEYELNTLPHQFKLKEENTMLTFKEGQTYVCKRDDLDWWTLDKEYTVQTFSNGRLYLMDDEGYEWYITNNLVNDVFKLKEKTFDLNTLTTDQLREYVGLLEDKEESENLLNEFIERMSK